MRKLLTVAAVAGLLVGFRLSINGARPGPVPNVKGRLWAGVQCRCVLDDDDTFTDPVFGTTELIAAKSAFGWGGDVEFRLARFFSFDVGLGYSSTSVEFSHSVGAGVQEDNLGMMPLFLGANVHVVSTRRVDISVGYLTAFMFYLNDVSFNVPGTDVRCRRATNSRRRGSSVGVDIATGERWAVNLAFRMVNADADSEHLLALDPTFITVGVTRKF